MRRAVGILVVAMAWSTWVLGAEPDGFGQMRWGDPAPKAWQQRQPVGEFTHSVRGRAGEFGGVPLARVDYEFSAGALARVALVFDSRQSFLGLKAHLEAAFGRPGEPAAASPASESLRWRGLTTHAFLNFVGEGAPALLYLCRAPGGADAEAGAAALEEHALLNRLHLYDLLDAAYERNLKAIASQIAWMDRALEEEPGDKHPCRALTVDAEQDQKREQRSREDWVVEQEAAREARARLRKEADAVRADLAALKGR